MNLPLRSGRPRVAWLDHLSKANVSDTLSNLVGSMMVFQSNEVDTRSLGAFRHSERRPLSVPVATCSPSKTQKFLQVLSQSFTGLHV